jgi:putative membrane protein
MSLPERFDKESIKLDPGTQLALRRTLLAHQRSLMAWIWTSASLIGFGFTTYKFFEYFREVSAVEPRPGVLGTRHFGMGLILVGVIANPLATIDYHRRIRA